MHLARTEQYENRRPAVAALMIIAGVLALSYIWSDQLGKWFHVSKDHSFFWLMVGAVAPGTICLAFLYFYLLQGGKNQREIKDEQTKRLRFFAANEDHYRKNKHLFRPEKPPCKQKRNYSLIDWDAPYKSDKISLPDKD
jgi:hypothetical protein